MSVMWRLKRMMHSLKRLIGSVVSWLTGLLHRSSRRKTMRDCSERLQRLLGLTVLGLMLLFLLGCAKPSQPCQKPHMAIPATLTSPTWVPRFQGENNEALLVWATALRQSLLSCNADKQAIREVMK